MSTFSTDEIGLEDNIPQIKKLLTFVDRSSKAFSQMKEYSQMAYFEML
ncbi:MAG: hypothetical protein J7604_25055 [Sporocytophaga sp.]|nr:hypothetical protein [Sporocytophaga sp.]MBO9703501.1 hypothetical protein [Sporocytophaga sp.]